VTEIGETQRANAARFDSVEARLRTLTQMVGQVLERLPEKPDGHSGRIAGTLEVCASTSARR
jgi:hypothetical protein